MHRVGLRSEAQITGQEFSSSLVCGRGRSQKDTKSQSEKAAAALQPKANARFLPTL